jgi:benzoate-CoA ligase
MSAEEALDFSALERFNLHDYYLKRNLEEGRGDKVCLISGDETRTYAELEGRVARCTAALRSLGVKPGERVLMVLPDGFEFAEVWFAVLRVGAVFAMVNPLIHAEQFEHYLSYSGARVAFGHADLLEGLAAAARASASCEALVVIGGCEEDELLRDYESLLSAEDPSSERAVCEPTGPNDVCGWLFTSGSTGLPKACVHTHAHFAFNTEHYAVNTVGYVETDLCLSVPKLFFGYATGTNLMFPFRVGAAAVLFPERPTADVLFEMITKHKPTFMTGVPTMFQKMLSHERFSEMDFSSVRLSLSAGEALPASLYAEWTEKTQMEILDGIGSAEMFHIYISNRPGDVKLGSLGKIVEGYETEIVGPDGAPVALGESGRLRVRGGSTAHGYFGDEEKTAETFDGEWCTTADTFRCDEEGYYYYEGRVDDLLKVAGRWVSPLEIEDALLTHPGVAESCVVGREGADGLTTAVAHVTPSDGAGSEELAAALTAHLKERLEPHKYPRSYEWHAELPRNDRGKIARKLLS